MTGGNKYLIMLDYCASLVPSGDRLNRRYVLAFLVLIAKPEVRANCYFILKFYVTL